MNKEEHQERHLRLHKKFDELFADFITHADGGTSNTIMDLIKWSFKQTKEVDHEEQE